VVENKEMKRGEEEKTFKRAIGVFSFSFRLLFRNTKGLDLFFFCPFLLLSLLDSPLSSPFSSIRKRTLKKHDDLSKPNKKTDDQGECFDVEL